jgi:hypothetical protein
MTRAKVWADFPLFMNGRPESTFGTTYFYSDLPPFNNSSFILMAIRLGDATLASEALTLLDRGTM